MGTPDLRFEGNPLVIAFGLGWPALTVKNIAALIIFVLLAYYYSVKYERKFVPCKNIKEFCSMLLYERPDKFYWIFYKSANNRKAFWALVAYAFIFPALTLRIVAVSEWLLVLQRNSWQSLNYWNFWLIYNSPSNSVIWNIYLDIKRIVPGGNIYNTVWITIGILIIPIWFLKEYKFNNMYIQTKGSI